ncbi:MAG TPA: ParA family protein [Methylomirabilota bacterium]|nr:ParA family protein [Methylomirabilota bacterium]
MVNLKGGTGKTTTSVFLATGLQRAGEPVLLVDADPQGSALSWSAADGFPVVTVAMPQPVLHRQIPALARAYRHVVMDCPPADEAIVRSALLAADIVVMPMAPSMLDLDRLRPTLALLAAVAPQNEPPFYALLTRVRARTRMSSAARTWLGALEVPVLVAEVPLRETYTTALGEVPPAGTEYEAVLAELRTSVGAEVSA